MIKEIDFIIGGHILIRDLEKNTSISRLALIINTLHLLRNTVSQYHLVISVVHHDPKHVKLSPVSSVFRRIPDQPPRLVNFDPLYWPAEGESG